MQKPSIIVYLALLLLPAALMAEPAGVLVDCRTSLHSYSRDLALGTNILGEWDRRQLYLDNAWRLRQGGMRLLRFPGGTNGNEYHWNGNGDYDSGQVWHNRESPRVTTFASGFYDLAVHRGSTVIGAAIPAKVTDGKSDTCWLSYPGDEPEQWIYLEIKAADNQGVPVNRAVIDWGIPYAVQFKIQYSNANTDGFSQYCYNDTAWTDTAGGTLPGTGGRSDITFPTVTAKYVRVCCLASSNAHNQYAINEIRLYHGDAQITRNQDDSRQTASVSSSVSRGDTYDKPDQIDFEQFMGIVRSVGPGAVPLIGVNLFTGTPQEAADWVYYANVVKGYGVKYWEVGNENWGNWEAGGPLGSAGYARRFIEYSDAMTAVDHGITVVPQFSSALDVENVTMDARTRNPAACQYYVDNFLRYLQEHGRADIIKAVSVHNYPTFQAKSEAAALANVDQWDRVLPLLKHWIGTRCQNPAGVKIYLTEYNDGIESGYTNHFYDALFVSGYLLNFLKNGGDFGCFFTSFGNPAPLSSDPALSSDFGMLEGGGLKGADQDKKYQPRASYYALAMLYNNFSADDALGNTLVSTSSSNSALKVYANKRGDKKLSLFLINIDPEKPVTVNITLNGFTPQPSAELVSYSRRNYAWVTRDGQSFAAPDEPPEAGVIDTVLPVFSLQLEPYSIKVITLREATAPVAASSPHP
ncbi:MAG: discoidin domain-containing protein [Opitutaceae bacterium]